MEEGSVLGPGLGLPQADFDLDASGAEPGGTTGRFGIGISDRGDDPLANYLLERVRQTHDIWHTLLGLGAQGHEEVLVHAFQWPQLGMPYSALVVLFGAIKHMALEGRPALLRHGLADAVAAGRAAAPLLAVRWERRWEQPLARVREELRIRPASTWRGLAG